MCSWIGLREGSSAQAPDDRRHPLTLAWPDARVGVQVDAAELAAEDGWVMVEPDAAKIAQQLVKAEEAVTV